MPPQNKLITGDCMQHLPDLPASSVSLAFADPPFNIGFDYGAGEHEDNLQVDEYLNWCQGWITAIYRLLEPAGTFWLAISDEYVSELDVVAKKAGFFKRCHVCWYYTFGVNSPKKFTRSHTHLLYFVKDKKRFTFNVDTIRVPSARVEVYGDKRGNPAGRLPDDTWILRPAEIPEGFTEDHSTWYYPRIAGTFHRRQEGAPNQMPEQLLGRIIRSCSHVGELVLDPFAGTGTTLAVAKKLGRRYLGFELSEKFAEGARRRIRDCRKGDSLDAPLPRKGE